MATVDELRDGFRMGHWQVLPNRSLLVQGETETRIEPLPMDVLVVLASRAGEVVSKDDLVQAVWKGRPVSDEVITRCISVIRRTLGDDARAPAFVENVPRRGYRLMCAVTLPDRDVVDPVPQVAAPRVRRAIYLVPLLGGFVAVAIVSVLVLSWPWLRSVDQPISSVVVLPFSCTEDKEYLCFGFSETLTSTLFRQPNLRVVKSRDAGDRDKAAREIVDNFDVDAFIEGQVRIDGRGVTVIADLIDGRNGKVRFSNIYSGDEETIYQLHEQVAADVRDQLAGNTNDELPRPHRPVSFAAFDRYSEGLFEFEKRSADSIVAAIALFEQTIDLDPDYGAPYLMLAFACALLPEYADVSQDDMYARAIEVAGRGARRDPEMAEATATIHAFIAHKRGDWIGADRNYQRALQSETVFPVTRHLYSRLLASVGRLDDALEMATRARQSDPDSAVLISRQAIANFWVGNLEAADSLFARAHRMDLQAPIQDLAYALLRIRQGRIAEARQLAKDGLAKYGADFSWVDTVFDGLEDPGKRADALALMQSLSERGLLPARVEITLWALMQEGDRALQVARRLETEGEVFEAELLFIPQFRVVREQPGFAGLLDAIGLTAYWQSVGCRWDGTQVRCESRVAASIPARPGLSRPPLSVARR